MNAQFGTFIIFSREWIPPVFVLEETAAHSDWAIYLFFCRDRISSLFLRETSVRRRQFLHETSARRRQHF